MKISKSPLSGKSYTIPSSLDDSEEIKKFISNHTDKKVVVVQGLGFVGAVMSLVCANALKEDYAVIGIDLPTENTFWKIKSINEGLFPLIAEDPKIEDFYEQSRQNKNFFATYDPLAYSYADVIIVDINLDVDKKSENTGKLAGFDVNLSSFKSAIKSIGENCKEDILVLVETTVPPGTCDKVVKPILDEEISKRGIDASKYRLGHSYERVMPGPEYINSIREFPRVYAGIDDLSANAVESFLKTIIDTSVCELTRLKHTNATEIAKVLENSYRAMNISFAVEWSRFAEEAGVDLYSIVDAIRERKTHANLMYPGIGVGGYCLTKDPLLASWSRKSFFNSESDLEMSIESVSTNDQMPRFAFQRLLEVFGKLDTKKVVFLGISYRGDVGDTRFSPVGPLLDMVEKEGAIVVTHDPYITFWEEKNREVMSDLRESLNNAPDIVIISTGHSLYSKDETIEVLMSLSPTMIFDTIGLFSEENLEKLNKKHTLSVLGRGDIK